MGRHRHDLGGSESFDEDGLRPATVEELAALERAEKPDRRRDGHRRPIVVALSTSALLMAGAGAFALARDTGDPAIMVEPNGAAAPFGVGYKDGFGEHAAKPSPTPSPVKSKTKMAAAPTYSPPGPQAPPSLGTLDGSPTSSPPNSLAPSTPPKEDGATATLSAVSWEMKFQNRYWVYVWVNNSGKTAANWQVTLTIPKSASVTSAWAVNKSSKGDGVWVLTPPRGSLGPGLTYLFAVEGISSDPFVLHSCTVNGASCDQFG